jgi:hypothetical protein
MMKNYIFRLLLILICSHAEAQQCKYLTNKISGMNGSRLVITVPYTLSANFKLGRLEVWSTLYGDTAVTLAFVVHTNLQLSVSRGDSIKLTLENAQRADLPILQDASSTAGSAGKLTIMTVVGKEYLDKLMDNLVQHIILPVNLGNLEGSPVNKKQSAAIRNVLGCVKIYLIATSK